MEEFMRTIERPTLEDEKMVDEEEEDEDWLSKPAWPPTRRSMRMNM